MVSCGAIISAFFGERGYKPFTAFNASTHASLSSLLSALKCNLFFVPVFTENLLSSDLLSLIEHTYINSCVTFQKSHVPFRIQLFENNIIGQNSIEKDHEMDFADGFALARGVIAVTSNSTQRLFPDDHRSPFDFRIEHELIGTVDFEIRENAILEYEPPRAPPATVIDPLVQDAGDSIPDNAIDHDTSVVVLARGYRGHGTLDQRGGHALCRAMRTTDG